jgi:transcriptional regulator with XRE-family HTH domain
MENNNKTQITKYLSDNIAYYRKKMSLTQLELANKLNYSDKSISKWKRGDGVPDIFVLKELSFFSGLLLIS